MNLLLVDGVKYVEYSYLKENELENSIKFHAKELFGEDSIFFEKKKLKSLSGIGSIPDGFVLDLKNEMFYVVEIELASHDVHSHIVNQLSRFINGMQNPTTHKKIVTAIYDQIKENDELKRKVNDKIGGGEIYRFLDRIVPDYDPQILMVINKNSEKVKEVVNALKIEIKIIEFRTFVRNNVGDLRVHSHLFEPMVKQKVQGKKIVTKNIRTKEKYRNTKIISFTFDSRKYEVKKWIESLIKISKIIYDTKDDGLKKALTLRGRTRNYFSHDPDSLVEPKKINGTDMYVGGNVSAESVVKIIINLISLYGYSEKDISFEVEK